jgi:hypothetical protein
MASVQKNESSTGGAVAAVEATAMRHQRLLWRMTGGSSGIGGGIGNDISGTVAMVG